MSRATTVKLSMCVWHGIPHIHFQGHEFFVHISYVYNCKTALSGGVSLASQEICVAR